MCDASGFAKAAHERHSVESTLRIMSRHFLDADETAVEAKVGPKVKAKLKEAYARGVAHSDIDDRCRR